MASTNESIRKNYDPIQKVTLRGKLFLSNTVFIKNKFLLRFNSRSFDCTNVCVEIQYLKRISDFRGIFL